MTFLTPQQQKALTAWYRWFYLDYVFNNHADRLSCDLFQVFDEARPQFLTPREQDPLLELTEARKAAIDLWCESYKAKVDRINGGSTLATYSEQEQVLFESFGFTVRPFEFELVNRGGPSSP